MKNQLRNSKAVAGYRKAASYAVMACMMAMNSPAFAQFDKVKTGMTAVQTFLISLGLIVCTIAILFVAFRMMFKKESFADHSHVFWGGFLGGSAVTIAGWLWGA